MELAAYFTHCQLQGPHLQLAVSSAMTTAYKYKNYETAMHFARRLLEMGPGPDKAQKVCISTYEIIKR
jgi:coatomer protein complex subunit alpha (xenin)